MYGQIASAWDLGPLDVEIVIFSFIDSKTNEVS